MLLNRVTAEEYEKACGRYQYFYDSMRFHELNKGKVDSVEYLIFGGSKKKLALAIGIRDGEIRVPYSAPFGMFEQLQPHIKLEEIGEAIGLLEQYGRENKINRIFFRLPPNFYDESFLAKTLVCLLQNGYQSACCDLNYQFYIQDMQKYESSLLRNARKNLKKALQYEFSFIYCSSEKEKREAYDIIAVNRSRKGYPLRMTYEQVWQTIQLTPHDFFLLKEGEKNIAAAIVFMVNEKCYQVIYWGDIGGYEGKRPMNYLAYKVYEFYVNKGIEVLDIGPSTEEGIPNYGLCDFKESIGCETSMKYSYYKDLI